MIELEPRVKLSKEEEARVIEEYKAKKAEEKAKQKAEYEARIAASKALTPEERKAKAAKEKEEQAARANKEKEDKKAAKLAKKEEKAKEKAYLNSLSKEERDAYVAKKKEERKAWVEEEYKKALAEKNERLTKKGNELNKRYDLGGKIHSFFFSIRVSGWWQAIANAWLHFKIGHPELAKWIYQVFYFIVFSEGVTVWQYLVMLFLPYVIGLGLAQVAFVWPEIRVDIEGTELLFAIFNEPMRDAAGLETTVAADAAIGGGLGNFIAYEIAVFTAQCINFPLQRNITFRSHGNPWYQAMWYFIGWVVISILMAALWGMGFQPFMVLWAVPKALSDLLKTFITGTVSMVVFFFVFKIIFPAGEAKKEETVEPVATIEEQA